MGVRDVTVIADTAEYQVIETITPNGSTRQVVFKAGSNMANAQTIAATVAGALTRLRQIQTQAAAFQNKPAYSFATLAAGVAAVNDLQSDCKTMAAAVADVAADLIGVARLLSNQYDGTG